MNEFFGLELIVEHGVEPKGILHVGAHYGEEADHYRAYVGENVVWIEGHPEYARKLFDNPEIGQQLVHQACVSDSTGESVDFWITADEYASSLLKPEFHQIQNPHAPITGKISVDTTTYADLYSTLPRYTDRAIHDACNVLVLDVQGAEMMVLRGMGERAFTFDAVATEYSTVDFYENGPRLEEIDEFLSPTYHRVFPVDGQESIHADALYIRRPDSI